MVGAVGAYCERLEMIFLDWKSMLSNVVTAEALPCRAGIRLLVNRAVAMVQPETDSQTLVSS